MAFARSMLAVLLMLAPAALANPGAITVTFLEGDADAVRHGGERTPLGEGSVLHEGETVETALRSRVEIAFPTGTLLRLGPRSRMELRAASADGGSFRAWFTLGNLWAKVHKLVAGQRFEVETQNGVAGVRGTEFRVAATAKGQALVRVYEGRVEVAATDGRWTHLVEPGRELRYDRKAVLGPRAFSATKEGGFMRWVRAKGEGASVPRPERSIEHREQAPERERRERLHRELHHQ
jgi:hypothetical protein